MDADCQERWRDYNFSQREKRWSMNSQRLEEIVAELMKPISDVRRSFDTDLSALLEEYLTEAGLHALEADADAAAAATATPNYAELALLLQHSASLYGRKVDFLYQHVIHVSDSLHNTALEAAEARGEGAEAAEGAGRRRERGGGGAGGAGGAWAPVEVGGAGAAARREPPARPPPTLPRSYLELEPRTLTAADAPLTDYDGEPIGLLLDFHVAWRLQEGLLVEELEGGARGGGALRPLPLLELQAALAAAAPPDPPPHTAARCSTPRAAAPPPPHPANALSPIPARSAPPTPLTPPTPPPPRAARKRRCEATAPHIADVKIYVAEGARSCGEFCVPAAWRRGVVRARAAALRAARRRARAHDAAAATDFRGFDFSDPSDIGGFAGWSASAGATEAATLRRDPDSDDDGFFEQSSLGESDASGGEWGAAAAAAAAAVAGRAAEAARPTLRALAAAVRASLPAPPAARPAPALLARAAPLADHHVAGIFLATLHMANLGEVEIVPGAPLQINGFAVRARSRS